MRSSLVLSAVKPLVVCSQPSVVCGQALCCLQSIPALTAVLRGVLCAGMVCHTRRLSWRDTLASAAKGKQRPPRLTSQLVAPRLTFCYEMKARTWCAAQVHAGLDTRAAGVEALLLELAAAAARCRRPRILLHLDFLASAVHGELLEQEGRGARLLWLVYAMLVRVYGHATGHPVQRADPPPRLGGRNRRAQRRNDGALATSSGALVVRRVFPAQVCVAPNRTLKRYVT